MRNASPGQQPSSQAEREARILQYWKAVELFSPQKIPRVNPQSRKLPVLRVAGEMPLPWEPLNWFRPAEEGSEWRFTAYCGVYKQDRLRLILEKKFGRDPANFDRRNDGESCLFAVQITAGGRPLLQTFALASAPWAAGRLLSPGAKEEAWLGGFESAAKEEALRFAERFAVLEGDEAGRQLNSRPGVLVGRTLKPKDLETEVECLVQSLGVAAGLLPKEVRLAGRQVSKKYSLEAQSDDFLNSFFLQDLDRVAKEAAGANLSPALSLYLTSDEALKIEERVDLRSSYQDLWQQTSPRFVPAGRWPAPADQSLYFSQQFAVNSALNGFENGAPLFGVNGPPGTGKTTLLRDLIASTVVRRAQALVALPRPEMALGNKPVSWQSDGYPRKVFPWHKDLLGFGMVVASSNNRAVENVTLEIPTKFAVAEEYRSQIEYFADFATRILGETKAKSTRDNSGEAWGLVAARLGSKKNRSKFVSRFWFAERDIEEPKSRRDKGFLEYLKSVKSRPSAWKNAVSSFERAMQEEAVVRDERVAAWMEVEARTKLAEELAAARAELRTAETATFDLEAHGRTLGDRQADSRKALEEAISARSRHQQFKPGLIDALFTLGASYREWRARDLALLAHIEAQESECLRTRGEWQSYEQQLAASRTRVKSLAGDVAALVEQLETQDQQILDGRAELGAAFPITEKWMTDFNGRELSSPWADERWNAARTRVFIEALHLHRAFIECFPAKLKSNLSAAMDLLKGKVSPGVPADSLRSAWATFFFVIPLISTTFASFDRLFAHCGRESIGWLLIDEGGQAVPQAVAGALWRSQRALVVGDPRQLEPIVSLPFTAQQALRAHFGVAETWLPGKASAQTLVDRVSRFGTWLQAEGSDEPIWVGSPLRVHRRCENPMFAISNQIAYSNQMVYGTQEKLLPLPRSAWLDVRSADSDEHWIPAEGLALEILIRDLLKLDAKPSSILLITPFRAVSQELKEIGLRHGIQQAGTIHVSQGRESDVVILVLGGDPRRLGAKEWASEKPNLLNVAVSRARRRLFVIGNRAEWSQYEYFSDVAALLSRGAEADVAASMRKSASTSSGSS